MASGIVKTRYRDVSWDELPEKLTAYFVKCGGSKLDWEKNVRGKPVSIVTPGWDTATAIEDSGCCKGPSYYIAGDRDGCSVCPCIAEIGD